jgi:hypothetical protein
MQIAIFKQPWRIKVKETLGVGHHYCPLRRSIPQPRDVNAIEQLRTAREATTIDSCGYHAPAANARNLAQLIAGHARTADCS